MSDDIASPVQDSMYPRAETEIRNETFIGVEVPMFSVEQQLRIIALEQAVKMTRGDADSTVKTAEAFDKFLQGEK